MNNRRLLLILVGISMILFVVVGTSYAYLTFSVTGDDNYIKASCLKLNIIDESEGINLENQQPMTDDAGKNLTNPYTFSVKNVCNTEAKYNIILGVLKEEDITNASNVKMYLTGHQTTEPKVVSESATTLNQSLSSIKASYLIDTATIGVGQTQTYSLRLWIAQNASSFTGGFDNRILIEASPSDEK